jgi:hypothetical protein
MVAQHRLLRGLLTALVEEWGHKHVASALAQLEDQTRDSDRPKPVSASGLKSAKARKITALEQVARAATPDQHAEVLETIASRFDNRTFLPSPLDIREFLLVMGERPTAIKDRSDAFRLILRKLVTLTPERLLEVANSPLHSGPSRLGPLSDAISAAAASLPRHREHTHQRTHDNADLLPKEGGVADDERESDNTHG